MPTAAVPVARPSFEAPLAFDNEAEPSKPAARTSPTSRTWVWMLVLCVVVTSVQSEYCTYIQSQRYQKPYFILWYSHSYFTLLLPLYMAYCFVADGWTLRRVQRALVQDAARVFGYEYVGGGGGGGGGREVLMWLFVRALGVTVILTAGTYFWYLAAGLTTPARLAAAANTACCFAYVFEVWMFGHAWRGRTVFAVCFGVAGVVVMSMLGHGEVAAGLHGAEADGWRHSMGDVAGMVSAALVGLFENVYKKYLTPREGSNTVAVSVLITAMMGLATLTTMWVPVVVLDAMGLEVFEAPTPVQLGQMTTNAVMSSLFNLGFVVVVAQAGPVMAAVGVMLSIPMIAVMDVAVMGRHVGAAVLVGGGMVMASFGMLIGADAEYERVEQIGMEEMQKD